jgi:hypothetical protein
MKFLIALIFLLITIASCKPNIQICASTFMRDSVIINGKDTTTIINIPPLSK